MTTPLTGLRSERSFDSINTRRLAVQLTHIGRSLATLADDDPRIVAASADLKFSTLMSEFEERHPDRFYQFGISERNMFGAAAGMASAGLRPYIATFASFAGILCYENIRTDLAYPDMPVRILATHSGISMGYFATSHHATEDISALRSVANLTVVSPADGLSAAHLIRETVDLPGPIYFRLSRGREQSLYEEIPSSFELGVPHLVRRGSKILLVATGLMVRNAVEAAQQLMETDQLDVAVLDVHTLKPFAFETVSGHLAGYDAVVVVEEHNVEGGLGTLVAEAAQQAGLRVPIYKHGLYDEFCIIGPPHHCYRYYGLDALGIATVVTRMTNLADSGGFFERSRSGSLWTDDDRRKVLSEFDVVK